MQPASRSSLRAAVVLEQCWHRVPGGTALAALRQVEAVTAAGGVEQIGVAARHGGPPRPAYRPSIPVKHLPVPRRLLYETWHRARFPRVERATGPVDVIHATGYAVPPRSAPLVATMHDLAWRHDPGNFTRNGVLFFEAGLSRVVADADLVLCPSLATLDDCVAAGVDKDRLRHVPWGMRVTDVDADEVARVRKAYGLAGRYVLFVGTVEPRKNLPRLLEAMAELPQTDVTLAVVGPPGWGDALGRRRHRGVGLRWRRPGRRPDGPRRHRRGPRPGPRRRRPGRPAALGRAGPSRRDDLGGHRHHDDRRLPRRGRRSMTMRVGCNLLWLVPGRVGGSEEATVALLRALAEQKPDDLHYTVYALDDFGAEYPDVAKLFPTRLAALTGRLKPLRVGAENTWLAGETKRAELDLVHHMNAVLPLNRPAPGVITIHDLQPFDMPENFHPVKRRYVHTTVPRSVRKAAMVVTPSEFVRQGVIERFGVDPERVRTTRWGVDAPRTDVTVAEVQDRYGLSSRWFVFNAVTWPHKNHGLLVRAFAKVAAKEHDVTLVLTGGEAQQEEPLAGMIDRLGLRGRVRRTG